LNGGILGKMPRISILNVNLNQAYGNLQENGGIMQERTLSAECRSLNGTTRNLSVIVEFAKNRLCSFILPSFESLKENCSIVILKRKCLASVPIQVLSSRPSKMRVK